MMLTVKSSIRATWQKVALGTGKPRLTLSCSNTSQATKKPVGKVTELPLRWRWSDKQKKFGFFNEEE